MDEHLIKTNRLGFRLLESNDIHLLEALESDADVKKYFPDGPRDRTRTEAMIQKFVSWYQEHRLPCFMMFELETGGFVGRAGFGVAESGEIEVGYVLHKKYWGQGLASEAVAALLHYARDHISAEHIIAYADVDNAGSTRVMEKCGMEYYKNDIAKGIECRFYRIKNR